MAFQLHIRQNVATSGSDFSPGEIRQFDQSRVAVGSGADCECRIDDPEVQLCHLLLETTTTHSVTQTYAQPREGAATYLQGMPLEGATALNSGDELRVGHWVFRFQRIYPPPGRNRHFSLLSSVAKALVALVLISEVAVVTWLPRRMHRAAMWNNEVARQRIAELADALRKSNRPTNTGGDFERALRRSVDRELRERAEFLARFGTVLGAARNRAIYEELLSLQRVLQAAVEGILPPDLPTFDIDSGVEALLRKHGEDVEVHER